jgi:hypothetical protein
MLISQNRANKRLIWRQNRLKQALKAYLQGNNMSLI